MFLHLNKPSLPAIFALSLFLVGCTANYHRRRADREADRIIDHAGQAVPGMTDDFRLEPEPLEPSAELPVAPAELRLFETSEPESPLLLLDLHDALRFAAANSHDYQARRESVFLQALALSAQRSRWHPQLFWRLRGDITYDSNREDGTLAGQSRPGMEWLLATGGRLAMDLSTTVNRFILGDPSGAARSALNLTLTQPLLRNSRIAAIEPLTQAEMDMLYEVRDFVRFQRRFTVSVLAEYYRALERRQRVENQRVNYQNLERIRARAEALGQAGRLPEMQVDRTRQDELGARDSLEQAKQDYLRAVDELKLTLGIRPEIELLPNPAEMERLSHQEMTAPPVDRARSIRAALENRLDLATTRDRLHDAERKVRVARNALRPGLDIILSATADTAENNHYFNFAEGSSSGYARMEADLPLSRANERSTYRRRLVERDRAERELSRQRDRVVLEVTNRWRDLERAGGSHEIQKRSVELARERVASTELLFDAGRATTRDVLDAYGDLLRAQNRLAQTMVDYRIAALELERDMDILVVDENGQIIESLGFDEITKRKEP